MILSKNETKLIGRWYFENNQMTSDEVCKRIDWLKTNHLKKLATDVTGWDVLFVDPIDGRYWELIYPNSEMHGGGPPTLINIPIETARTKYSIEP